MPEDPPGSIWTRVCAVGWSCKQGQDGEKAEGGARPVVKTDGGSNAIRMLGGRKRVGMRCRWWWNRSRWRGGTPERVRDVRMPIYNRQGHHEAGTPRLDHRRWCRTWDRHGQLRSRAGGGGSGHAAMPRKKGESRTDGLDPSIGRARAQRTCGGKRGGGPADNKREAARPRKATVLLSHAVDPRNPAASSRPRAQPQTDKGQKKVTTHATRDGTIRGATNSQDKEHVGQGISKEARHG